MAIDSTHPLYSHTIEDFELMRHAVAGERVIKGERTKYLPPTPGMIIDGMTNTTDDGYQAYQSYLSRAVYPDYVSDAVEALVGLLHQKPATIELPAVMEPMLLKATVDGESLQNLLRRINVAQLTMGRVGALLDLPETPDPANPLPFISLYNAEAMRNWDEGNDGVDVNKLMLVVLNESGFIRDENLQWKEIRRFRVLMLGDGTQANIGKNYAFGLFVGVDAKYNETELVVPLLRGKALEEIPFVFINSKDILPRPDNPPLLGLARLCMTIYRGEADYRQALFLQGQDTLVVIGGTRSATGEEASRVGAGAKLDVEMGGDAKYIGVSSTGLPEMRQSLENDHSAAKARTGQLVDAMGSKQESGDALETRLAAQTATLNQIAATGAAALENLLKQAATWLGANPDEVKVTPNFEFADMKVDGKELVDLISAKNMGFPLSKQSLHELAQERGLTKLDYDAEMTLIEDEDPLMGTLAGGLATVIPPVPPDATTTPPPEPASKTPPAKKK